VARPFMSLNGNSKVHEISPKEAAEAFPNRKTLLTAGERAFWFPRKAALILFDTTMAWRAGRRVNRGAKVV